MINGLFVPTGNSGINYWRMHNFYNSGYRQGIMNFPVIWWQKDLYEVHPWERDVHQTEHFWRITKELQDWAVQAEIIVFGMLHGPGVSVLSEKSNAVSDYLTNSMAMFMAIKDMFPNKPILTEIDDDMLSTPPYNPAAPFYVPEGILRKLVLMQMKESDGVITSTPRLAEIYSDFNTNIHVIPNAIDFKVWDKAKNARKLGKKGIRIGWAGGANHEDDLKIMEKVIPAITAKHKNVEFTFVHGCPHYLRDIPGVTYKSPWTSIDKYPKMLAQQNFDIGIAPLIDNAFNRGKSNLRWLEYSALGIPTVASNVGNFKETLNHGKDGLLADNAEEFIAHLAWLIGDRTFRRQMGLNAWERVRKDFNVDKVTDTYAQVLEREIEKKNATKEAEVLV